LELGHFNEVFLTNCMNSTLDHLKTLKYRVYCYEMVPCLK